MSILSVYIAGFTLGLGAALPLGPINLLIMNEALKNYIKAVAIGLGAMSVDITYLVLLQFGITNYLKEAIALNILSIIGGLFLIYLAFLIFKGRNHHIHRIETPKETNIFSNYVKGYLLTLLNPYTVLFWLSVTTYSISTQFLGVTVLGMITAIMIWITIMPYVIYKKRTLISDELSSVITVISSIIILLFGFSLLLKGFNGNGG